MNSNWEIFLNGGKIQEALQVKESCSSGGNIVLLNTGSL